MDENCTISTSIGDYVIGPYFFEGRLTGKVFAYSIAFDVKNKLAR